MKALQQARRQDSLGRWSAERIQHNQLSRVVGELDLSPEGEEASSG